jgi:hypothetical protein
MTFFIKTYMSRFEASAITLLLLGTFLWVSGCSTIGNLAKQTKGVARHIGYPDGGLKKKIVLGRFENKSAYTDPHLEDLVRARLGEELLEKCSDLLLMKPEDPQASHFSGELPRDETGKIQSHELARLGRRLGLNAVINGAIIDIRREQESRGMLWFKDTYYFIRIQILTEVYDTETGAKLLDESFSKLLEVDEWDSSLIMDKAQGAAAEIHETIDQMAVVIGEKVREAIQSQPWKGYIIAGSGKNVTISSGSEIGLRAGDVLDVYDSGQVIKGARNQLYFLPGLKIGKVKLEEVLPSRSEAVITSGENVRAGCSVKAD